MDTVRPSLAFVRSRPKRVISDLFRCPSFQLGTWELLLPSRYEATMDSTAQNPYAGSSLRQMVSNGLNRVIEKEGLLIPHSHFWALFSPHFHLYSLKSVLPRNSSYHNYAFPETLELAGKSHPSPHPGPCTPPSLLTAPVGFSKTEKIQNTLFEAKWPQEEIHANITKSDKEYSSFWPLTHIRMHVWEELPNIKLKKHTTSFLWFLYHYFRQAWTNSTNSIAKWWLQKHFQQLEGERR